MTFTSPAEERYLEDYVPGDIHEFGSIVVQEDEMIAFAQRFDPNPFTPIQWRLNSQYLVV